MPSAGSHPLPDITLPKAKGQEGSLTYVLLSHLLQGTWLASPTSLHHGLQQLAKVSRKIRKTIIIVTGLIISAARVTGAEQLPVLTACGRERLNCITQKSNEGRSQLASRQQLQGKRRAHTNHCGVAQSHPVWSCQPRLKESDTRHMAPAGLQGAARLCALAGINGRILSSKYAAEKLSSRGGLGLALCHAPCRS